MTSNLTSRQKQTIQKRLDAGKPLTGTSTIFLGIPYQADLVALLEDNPDRFGGNLSGLVRDMIECYKKNGVDWRNDNDSQLDEIREAIADLKASWHTGGSRGSEEAANKNVERIDDSEGFSE